VLVQVFVLQWVMHEGRGTLGFEFNVDAVMARSSADLAFALELSERRAAAAEQALVEARLAHQEAEAARALLQAELAASEVAKRELWAARQVLANENELLMRRIGNLVQQLSQATSRDLQLELAGEISRLQRQVDEKNRSLYGSSSERRPQVGDGANGDESSENKRPRRRKQTGAKRTDQPKLPIREVHHGLTDAETRGGCRECDGNLVEMEGQTEDSEEVGVQRIRYELRVHRCQKYRCTGCGWITTAPGSDKLVPGGRYGIDFAVQVAIDKYEDALPLNRQVKRMKREGLVVTTQTLWDQVEALYRLLVPTLLVIHARILQATVCFADETPWRMMPKEGGSKRWWLWTVSDGTGVYFQLVASRCTAAARSLLRDYAGILMSDDYIVYSALERARSRHGGVQQVIDEHGKIVDLWTPDYLLATCWMHARRYLFKAERYHPEASPALDLIAEIYQVETACVAEVEARRKAAQGGEDTVTDQQSFDWLIEARRRRRDTESRPLVAQLDAWRQSVVHLEGTALTDAVKHLDRLWSRLILFLDDPRIPLDNGHAERQVRGPVVGRNNYAGSRSEAGARVAALFFSLIATARNLGLDPNAYLIAAATHARRNPGAAYTPWDQADAPAQAETAQASQADPREHAAPG
jgi:transposase